MKYISRLIILFLFYWCAGAIAYTQKYGDGDAADSDKSSDAAAAAAAAAAATKKKLKRTHSRLSFHVGDEWVE
jgi:hypothetical protein